LRNRNDELVAQGQGLCIGGVTRNANLAKQEIGTWSRTQP
jgi:hypothetical protein